MKKQYISYQETIDFLKQAMAEHPNLIRVDSIGETHEGRPIMMATISRNVAHADDKPALLYTGTIHAREWIGIELATRYIRHIMDNHQSDPHLLNALTRNTLYMVPCLNPDGFEYSRNHFSFWRKNRRDNGDGTFGVDLNRNFPVRFRKNSDTTSNVYGGPSAFSEPETRAIRDFVESHPNITVALDYHSQGNVFFPAHKFNHEEEVEGADLNILCANMASEIYKVTGRQYGIHRGKPPFNLIHGSGREYYYSKGILPTVVEVGTRNIPDYLMNMSQSVDENIPALTYALDSAINYSKHAPKRVEWLTAQSIGTNDVTLSWEYDQSDDCHFEIYRSTTAKSPCNSDNRLAVTKSLTYSDVQLNSGQRYFYHIRVVNPVTGIKSAFTPTLKIRTLLTNDEFLYTLFPGKNDVGYVGEKTRSLNPQHFGYNSLFVGVNRRKGCCYGVVAFDLDRLPADAVIKKAVFSLYPMNRVNAKIEKFGEWSVSILDTTDITDLGSYEQITGANVLQTLGDAIESDRLTQGVWTEWSLTEVERRLLQQQIDQGKLVLRIEGPDHLPLGNDSQMMQFDIGYGRFGGGIHYRPNLEVIYTRASQSVTIKPTSLHTITENEVASGKLMSGFDSRGNKIYGDLSFDLTALPDPKSTVITSAYVRLKAKNQLKTRKDIRFTMELVELEDLDHNNIQSREQIEYVGYEVSNKQLRENASHNFMFDSFCRTIVEDLHAEDKPVHLVVRPTTPSAEKNAVIDWHDLGEAGTAELVINYIERRKLPLPAPEDLTVATEGNKVRLSWKNPEHEDFVGCYVIRNRFHPPCSPMDGIKLYAGPDGYTYDDYGNPNIPKYYAVFSYDNVPNYSAPVTVSYSVDEVITVIDDDLLETQEEEEERLSKETTLA